MIDVSLAIIIIVTHPFSHNKEILMEFSAFIENFYAGLAGPAPAKRDGSAHQFWPQSRLSLTSFSFLFQRLIRVPRLLLCKRHLILRCVGIAGPEPECATGILLGFCIHMAA